MTRLHVSRRQFVASAAALAAGGLFLPSRAWALARRADSTFYKWQEVAPGFQVALSKTSDFNLVGGNSTLLVKSGAGVIIDTKQTVLGPSLKREAMGLSGAVLTVLNTHHHADHTGGNAAFSEAGGGGAKMMGHAKCHDRVAGQIANYAAQLDQKIAIMEKSGADGAAQAAADAKAFKEKLATIKPEAFIPDGTLENGKTLDLAGHSAEVHHVGAGHTDNDVFFFFPKENVLVAGDLVFNGLHAYYDSSGGANTAGWTKSLQEVSKLCNAKTVVVPGHGDIGDIEAVNWQIKYFEDVNAAVVKAIKEGKTREDVVKMTLPQYEGYGLKQATGLVMGGVFDEQSKGK